MLPRRRPRVHPHVLGWKESQHEVPAGKRQVASVSTLQTKRCYLFVAVMQRINRVGGLLRGGGNLAEARWTRRSQPQ